MKPIRLNVDTGHFEVHSPHDEAVRLIEHYTTGKKIDHAFMARFNELCENAEITYADGEFSLAAKLPLNP